MLLSILALSLAMQGATPAAAPSAFSTDEAARCAATFAFTLDAMRTAQGVPVAIQRRMRDGLAIWEYELARSAPGADPATLQAAANRAVGAVRATMPQGDTADAAEARGDFLTEGTARCGKQIETAYRGAEHPVIPFLRKSELAVAAPPAAQPVVQPVAATGEPKAQRRGLR